VNIVKIRILIGLALVLAVVGASIAWAQKKVVKTQTNVAPLVSMLPQSDALAIVNVRQLLDQAVPKMLAQSPNKLAEVNAEIDKFKTRTGIDARAFDQAALSLRYTYPAPGISKIESVVLARGTFNASAIIAAGRIAGNGKYREEKYQGHTIYVFSLDEQIKLLGLLKLKVNELAITAVKDNVVALGTTQTVKTAIDAGKRRGPANQELIALATRDPNAAVGFGGNVTPELLKTLNVPNDQVAKDISTIRRVFGTVGVNEKDVAMLMTARTVSASSAKNLGDTLEGVKQIAGLFVGRLPAAKGAVARTALDNLKITALGNELQIRLAVAQVDLGPLLRTE
jgi:hypothetical protein